MIIFEMPNILPSVEISSAEDRHRKLVSISRHPWGEGPGSSAVVRNSVLPAFLTTLSRDACTRMHIPKLLVLLARWTRNP